eukprot:TRINITY_DN3196_c0_g1_i10.p5 TRINITY_DN3196_c0_g1~~TRINITY_DN3196_c0_g1_i10.p5  ORF type:complete len:105 (+),score=1.90 TRINITY_DN3196_c0_g1_i10:613-927(+)
MCDAKCEFLLALPFLLLKCKKIQDFKNQRKYKLFMQTQFKLLYLGQMAWNLMKQLVRYLSCFTIFNLNLNQIAYFQEEKSNEIEFYSIENFLKMGILFRISFCM